MIKEKGSVRYYGKPGWGMKEHVELLKQEGLPVRFKDLVFSKSLLVVLEPASLFSLSPLEKRLPFLYEGLCSLLVVFGLTEFL